MRLERLDHYTINTAHPEETIAFYCDVLGFVNLPERRPDFGFPGAWFFVDDHPIVHVVFVEDDRAAPTGPIDHIAFAGSGYLTTRAELDAAGIDHTASERPDDDLLQVFVTDPNGVRIEINFRGEADAVAAARSTGAQDEAR